MARKVDRERHIIKDDEKVVAVGVLAVVAGAAALVNLTEGEGVENSLEIEESQEQEVGD